MDFKVEARLLFSILFLFPLALREPNLEVVVKLPKTAPASTRKQIPTQRSAPIAKQKLLNKAELDELDQTAFLASFKAQASDDLIDCIKNNIKSDSYIFTALLNRSGRLTHAKHVSNLNLNQSLKELPTCFQNEINKMDFQKQTKNFRHHHLEIQWLLEL